MNVELLICDSCKRGEKDGVNPKSDGTLLAEEIIAGAGSEITVRKHTCLMSCEKACNIALQAKGKITYVLGGFKPCSEDAQAILEYAQKYKASSTGQVPYREWPLAIKGHFIARIPPLHEDV